MPYAKVLLDENLDVALASALRSVAFDVIAAEEAHLKGASDPELLREAVRQERAVLTLNVRHYVPLAEQYAIEGKSHSGIILTTREPLPTLIARMRKLLSALAADDLRNRLLWLNDFK